MTGFLDSWLPLPGGCRVATVERIEASGTTQVMAVIESRQRTSACPSCGRRARHVHSRYTRMLRDVSLQNQPVTLRVRVRRFRCQHRRCAQRVFCERLPDLADTYARKTNRLQHKVEKAGLALGGRRAARFLEDEGQPVGYQTLLRSIRKMPCPEVKTPRYLGVDAWAMRKGYRYGTILVDLEEHHPVDLLPDRTTESLAEWLRGHPGVEVISRDRANAYAEGARLGAPDVLHVADRFHLAKNLGDAVERLLNRHRTVLGQAWEAARESETERKDAIVEIVDVAADPMQVAGVSASTNGNTTRKSRYEEEKHIRRAWRYGRYEQIKAYHGNGWNISRIARAMHLGRRTVRTLLRADIFPERKPYSRRRTLLDDFVPDIQSLLESGCHNGAAIFRELKVRGYTGQDVTVRMYVHTLRTPIRFTAATAPMREERAETDRCSPRRVANMVLKKPEGRSAWEQKLLAEVDRICEPFRVFHALAQRFLDLLRSLKDKGSPVGFTAWMADASESQIAEVKRFAQGLEQDRAAVEAAMALPWSNGPVEGAVNRLKTIKRQMYGRANFDLLRRRVLEPA